MSGLCSARLETQVGVSVPTALPNSQVNSLDHPGPRAQSQISNCQGYGNCDVSGSVTFPLLEHWKVVSLTGSTCTKSERGCFPKEN